MWEYIRSWDQADGIRERERELRDGGGGETQSYEKKAETDL